MQESSEVKDWKNTRGIREEEKVGMQEGRN